MKYITLLTDFGLKDGYVGVMKGVIWGICPGVQIADITHSVSPQNVLEGAIVLERTAPFFPEGTVHVAVVDPGVGTRRRPIAARLGEQFFVGPDNGLFTLLLEKNRSQQKPVEVVHLDQPRYWLGDVSNVFHGRDIFAPVAAHLANGVPLASLGSVIQDAAVLYLPQPKPIPGGWSCQIITIDQFGNLATNLMREQLSTLRNPCVKIGGQTIIGLSATFWLATGGRPDCALRHQ